MNLNFEEPKEVYPINNWEVPKNAEEEFARAVILGNFTYAEQLRAYNLDYDSFEMSHLLVTLALDNKPVRLLFLLEGAPPSYVELLEPEFVDLCIMRRADVLEIMLNKNVGRDQCLKGLIECLINNAAGRGFGSTIRILLNYIDPNTDVPNEYLGSLVRHDPPYKLLTTLAYFGIPKEYPELFKESISKGADWRAADGQLYKECISTRWDSGVLKAVLEAAEDPALDQEAFDYYMTTLHKNSGTSWLEIFSGRPLTVSKKHLKIVYSGTDSRSWYWVEEFFNYLGQYIPLDVKNYGLDLVKNDPKNDIFKNIFLREMLEMGADPNYNGGELLWHFVDKADITNVKELLNHGAIVPEDILGTSGDSSVNILLRRSYDMQQKLKKRIQEQLDRTYYPNES